jgi:hypothetical protein
MPGGMKRRRRNTRIKNLVYEASLERACARQVVCLRRGRVAGTWTHPTDGPAAMADGMKSFDSQNFGIDGSKMRKGSVRDTQHPQVQVD